MVIHVVRPGDSIYSIAQQYGVPLSQLLNDNQLPDPARLVVGQTIVVRFPQQVHTVQPGQTLTAIAQLYGVSVRQLQRNNPVLGGGVTVYPGQTLVISYRQELEGTLSVNGYAYPFIDKALLRATLPYLTFMTPFTYGITPDGGLVDLDDRELIAMAEMAGVAPLMHLSTLTEEGGFSNELASLVLNNADIQNRLIDNLVAAIQAKGYRGLDVDFEFVFPQDAGPYAAFIRNLTQTLNPLGLPVIVALAPKTSATQRGLLYEGHDYAALGAAANEVLLMTYEWGYTYTHIRLQRQPEHKPPAVAFYFRIIITTDKHLLKFLPPRHLPQPALRVFVAGWANTIMPMLVTPEGITTSPPAPLYFVRTSF